MRWIRIFVLCGILLTAGCNLTVESTPDPSADRPTIEFMYPTDNTTVLSGTDVQIQLLARDEHGSGVAHVELTVDDLPHQQGSPVEQPTVPVFTIEMNWLAQGDGLHQMTATAYRQDGTASASATIRLNVIEPPSVTSAP